MRVRLFSPAYRDQLSERVVADVSRIVGVEAKTWDNEAAGLALDGAGVIVVVRSSGWYATLDTPNEAWRGLEITP